MSTGVGKLARGALFTVITLVIGAAVALGAMMMLSGTSLFGSQTASSNTQIVKSVTREEQVVLLSLGIEGISQKNTKGEILGIEIPGSERALFLRYSFTAKLGLEGKDVTIEETGENQFLVSIPGFIFIGHDDPTFEMAAQQDGVLSWTTPEIDTIDMINEILSDEAMDQYLQDHEDLLRDQAKAFYGNIINSIDPTVVVTFEFDQADT